MVLDSFSNFSRYRCLHPLFSKVAGFMAANSPDMLKPGKADVGHGIKISINEYQTKQPEEKRAEYHRAYIDIQLLLSGSELFGYCCFNGIDSVIAPYDKEKDVGFVKGQLDFCTLSSGRFAIFFPDDVHMPGVTVTRAAGNTGGTVRKAVFKVPVE